MGLDRCQFHRGPHRWLSVKVSVRIYPQIEQSVRAQITSNTREDNGVWVRGEGKPAHVRSVASRFVSMARNSRGTYSCIVWPKASVSPGRAMSQPSPPILSSRL